jgi:hypothetical protein
MPRMLWVSAVCLALAAGAAARAQAPVELKDGDKAPDFSLPGTDGKTQAVRLQRQRPSSLRGSQRPLLVVERPNAGRPVRAAQQSSSTTSLISW